MSSRGENSYKGMITQLLFSLSFLKVFEVIDIEPPRGHPVQIAYQVCNLRLLENKDRYCN